MISAVADSLIRRMIELGIESEGPPPAEFCLAVAREPRTARAGPLLGHRFGAGLAGRAESDPITAGAAPAGDGADGRVHARDRGRGRRLHPGDRLAARSARGHRDRAASRRARSRTGAGSIRAGSAPPSDNRVLIAVSILLDGRVVYGPADDLDVKALLFEEAAIARPAGMDAAPGAGREAADRVHARHRRRSLRGASRDASTSSTAACCRSSTWRATRRLRGRSRLTATLDRLHAAGRQGVLDQTEVRVLEEAYELFSALRLDHQVAQLEARKEPDDQLDPRSSIRSRVAICGMPSGRSPRCSARCRARGPRAGSRGATDSNAVRTYRERSPPEARTPWREAAFSVVDLELTGLDPRPDEIISFAGDHRRGRQDPARRRRLRARPAAADAGRRHHADPRAREADLAEAPALDEVLDELLDPAHRAGAGRARGRGRGGVPGPGARTRGLDLRNPVIDTAALAEELRRLRRASARGEAETEPGRSRRASRGSRAGWGFPSIGPTTPMATRSRPPRSSSPWPRTWRSSAR